MLSKEEQEDLDFLGSLEQRGAKTVALDDSEQEDLDFLSSFEARSTDEAKPEVFRDDTPDYYHGVPTDPNMSSVRPDTINKALRYKTAFGIPLSYTAEMGDMEALDRMVAKSPAATVKFDQEDAKLKALAAIGAYSLYHSKDKSDAAKTMPTETLRQYAEVYKRAGIITDAEAKTFDFGAKLPSWAVPSPELFYQRTTVEAATDVVKGFSSGAANSLAAILAGIDELNGRGWYAKSAKELLGVAGGEKYAPKPMGLAGELSETFRLGAAEVGPKRGSFIADVSGGFGSMSVYALLGRGTASMTARTGISRALAIQTTSDFMSVFESIGNAGDVYQQSLQETGDQRKAERAFDMALWGNLPFNLVMNRVLFAQSRHAFIRGFTSEGTQEGGQSLIEDVAMDKPMSADKTIYSVVLGGLTGGPTATLFDYVSSKTEAIPPLSDENVQLYNDTVEESFAKGMPLEKAHIEATRAIAMTPDGAETVLATGDAMTALIKAEASIGRPDVAEALVNEMNEEEAQRFDSLTDIEQVAEILGEDETTTDDEAVEAVLSGDVEALAAEEVEGEPDTIQKLSEAIGKPETVETLDKIRPGGKELTEEQKIQMIVQDSVGSNVRNAQAEAKQGNIEDAKESIDKAIQQGEQLKEADGAITEAEVDKALSRLPDLEGVSPTVAKRVKTFEASEISQGKLPKSTSKELPSKLEKGKYFDTTAQELQEYLDTHGDGFLYRVVKPAYFEEGFDTGNADYGHTFKDGQVAKSTSLTTSFEDAKNMVDLRGKEEYIIYRVLPEDVATEFVAQIPSSRSAGDEFLHIHSPNPISIKVADVVYRYGKEVEINAGFRVSRESDSRGKATEAGGQGLRADVGRAGRGVSKERSKPPTKTELHKARRVGALQGTGLDKSDIKLIREDEALKAAFTKAVQAARIAYREGKAAGTEQADMEALSKEFDLRAQALREKLTAEQVKERLNQRIQETRARAAQAIQEFRDKLETARAQARQANERRKAVEHLKRIKKSPLSSIDVEFQKRITAILDVLKLTKPSGIVLRESNKESVREAQAEAMAAIKEFGEWSTANKAAKVSPGRIEQLTRLGQIPTASLTDADMAEINKVISELYELGKVKRELKLVYQKAELDAEIAAAVGGTVNRDIKMAKKYRPTKLEEWQRGLRKAYMDTMTTARVTDWLDGVEGYKGYNTSWIKRFGIRERNAKVNHEAIVSNALQEIVDQTGVVEWTEEQQIDMMINIRAREGAWDAVAALMEHYKGITIPTLQNERGDTIIDTQSLEKIIPKIDQDQERAIGVLQKHMGENTDRLAALVEEITNKPFVKLDTYILPLKYEQQLDLDATKSVDQGMHRTTQTRQGFKYERQAGVKKLPRTDLFGIFSEGILDQQWYMELQPELEQARHIFLSKAYGDAAGELGATWWANQLDIIARRGWMSTATNSELLRLGRVNLNQAILGYRLSTILLQPMAVADMAAFMVPKYGVAVSAEIVKQFTRSWVVPGTSQEIIEGSKSLQHRQGGELAIEEVSEEQKKFGKLRRWFTKNSMSLIQKADIKTAAGAWQAAKEILMKNGYSEAEASAEADFIMNLASGSTEITLRPQILARGEGARFWFTFGSFALNRWGIIVHDIGRAGIFKKGARNKARAITAAAMLYAMGMAEGALRDLLYKGDDEEEEDFNLFTSSFVFFASYIPFLGSLIESAAQGTRAQPPLLRVASTGVGGVKDMLTAEDEAKQLKGVLKVAESVLSLGVGMPGTAQLFDLIDYATKED